MLKPTHHYIGRCKHCGAILASVYDMTDRLKETGRAVGDMYGRGLIVSWVPLGSVEIAVDGCKCSSDPTLGLPLFTKETPL